MTGDEVLFEVAVTCVDGTATLALRGELDISTSPILRDRLEELVAGGHVQLELDARSLEFLDSTGITVIVGARRLAQPYGGDIKITGAKPGIVKTLEIVGLRDLLG